MSGETTTVLRLLGISLETVIRDSQNEEAFAADDERSDVDSACKTRKNNSEVLQLKEQLKLLEERAQQQFEIQEAHYTEYTAEIMKKKENQWKNTVLNCHLAFDAVMSDIEKDQIQTKEQLDDEMKRLESICPPEILPFMETTLIQRLKDKVFTKNNGKKITELNLQLAEAQLTLDGERELNKNMNESYCSSLEEEIKRLKELLEFREEKEKEREQREATAAAIEEERVKYVEKYGELDEKMNLSDEDNAALEDWLKKNEPEYDQNRKIFEDIRELLTMKRGAVRIICRFKKPNWDVYKNKQTFEKYFYVEKNQDISQERWWGVRFKRPKTLLYTRNGGGDPRKSIFEKVFFDDTQDSVYESIEPFVLSALSGKTIGVLAYGASGAGKTYSMIGDEKLSYPTDNDPRNMIKYESSLGIMPRVMKKFFSELGEQIEDMNYEIFEIYSEAQDEKVKKVFDLLGSYEEGMRRSQKSGNLYVRSGGKKVFTCWIAKEQANTNVKYFKTGREISGQAAQTREWYGDVSTGNEVLMPEFTKVTCIKQENVSEQVKDFMEKFEEVITIRKTDDNQFNKVSSRSHLIVRVNITGKSGVKNSAYFVDLAGREGGGGVEKTQAGNEVKRGVSVVGQHINKSLKSISAVIREKKAEECFTKAPENQFKDLEKVCKKVDANVLSHLCRELFTQYDSKVMMLLCLHPILNVEVNKIHHVRQTSSPRVKKINRKWVFNEKEIKELNYEKASNWNHQVLKEATTGQ